MLTARSARAWAIALTAVYVLTACGARPISPHPDAGETVSATPAVTTVISLTFDDAYEDQWLYARPVLRAYHVNATFYVITADSVGPYRCCMSWAQLRMLQQEGDDIGSHTINHPNLTELNPSRISAEVCGSRRDLLTNGIRNPQSFAYPFGSSDARAERIVEQCGYSNARQGGGVSLSNTVPGPPYADTQPPTDPYSVRTIAADGADPIQLSHLQAFVTAASQHGGGWLPITFHQVCDSSAGDYAQCMSTYGPITDTVLARFLMWLQDAGRPAGGPAGVVVQTMQQVMAAAG
jgi:peptidoglycan/xylan/chitin deacetylase (PgdA/CDA1 family)